MATHRYAKAQHMLNHATDAMATSLQIGLIRCATRTDCDGSYARGRRFCSRIKLAPEPSQPMI